MTLATFMEVLDTSIANVALPHIAGSLRRAEARATWVLTSYLVANAIVLPISGWLIGLFGRKRFYMSCVALFTISSALCGVAPNLALLIVFRILQGVGGGGLQPSEQGILVDTFPVRRGAWPWPSTEWPLWWRRSWARRSAAGSPTTTRGLDFLYQRADRYPVALSHQLHRARPPGMVEEIAGNRRQGWNVDYVGLSLAALGFGSLEVVYAKAQEWDWLGDPFYGARRSSP